jgi:SsrA-binding protein
VDLEIIAIINILIIFNSLQFFAKRGASFLILIVGLFVITEKEMEIKIIAQAKKKLRNYRIIEEFTSGLELNGQEIKSLRNYQSSIDEAYISPQHGELYIINMHITPYKYSRAGDLMRNCNNKRKRKLLLTQKEIKDLIFQARAKNYAIIPLLLFINSRG